MALTVGVIPVLWDRTYVPYLIGLVCFVAISYRLVITSFAPRIIGIDPNAFAVQVQLILNTGSIDPLNIPFYDVAPVFQIFTVTFTLISETSVHNGMAIWTVVSGLLVPLLVFVFGSRSWPGVGNQVVATIAAVFASVGVSHIQFSYWPVPSMVGALFFIALLIGFIMYVENPSNRYNWSAVIGVFSLAAMFTHKLPIFAFLLVFCVFLLIRFIDQKPLTYSTRGSDVTLILVVGIIVSLQFLYLTDFLRVMITYISQALSGDIGFGAGRDLYAPAATSAIPPFTTRAMNRIGVILLLGIGGIVWMWLFIRSSYSSNKLNILLSASGVTAVLVVVGTVTPAGSLRRNMLLAELVVVVLVGGGIWIFARTILYNRTFFITLANSILVIGLIGIIIVSQFMAPPTTIDHPDEPRYYLNNAEIKADEFRYDRVPNIVVRDYFYAYQVSDIPQAAEYRPDQHQQGSKFPRLLEWMDRDGYLIGDLADRGYESVAIRPELDIYLFRGGPYYLEWDPEKTLDRRQEYHRGYDNGDVVLYMREN